MSDQTIEVKLSSNTMERLQVEAHRQQRSLTDVVTEAIETYLDEETIEDTPDEVIVEAIREGMKEALSGRRGRSARDVLAEIRQELKRENGDNGDLR